MKTIPSILIGSALVFVVGCGESTSSNDPGANASKPELKQPIPDSPSTGIGITSATDAPAGITPGGKKSK